MTLNSERWTPAAPRDSATMLAALGILAYAASMMTHEALGHGGYCLAAGGHNTMLTAWRETCEFPGAASAGIKAAGPGTQFAAGLLAWLALHLLPPYADRLRFFLWLYMVFNLFVSSSYLAFSGVTNFGDAAELIAALQPHFVWRGGLILLGSAVYSMSMLVAALELRRLAGGDHRRKRLFQIVWIPYVAAGIFACCTAALNGTMGHWAAIGMAVASSFGAGTGMLLLPAMQRRMELKLPLTTVYLTLSPAWVAAAAFVVMAFVFVIGPGMK